MNINTAMVMGNLTQDPQVKDLPSGMKVASFTIATNRKYKDQEQVEYHNIVAFGKTGELVAKYLKKGGSAFVSGRLQTRNWEKDGVKHYRTEIVANEVQFGPKKQEKKEEPQDEWQGW